MAKDFYMLFNSLDGGVVEPIELDKSQFQDDRSLILMDEEHQTVWLWHGKLRGLVQRRTALRQAQSLKGHGYKAGNAIIGRDLRELVEIDARKIDRVPEDTELNEKLMKSLDGNFSNTGNWVYVKGAGSASSSSGSAHRKASLESKPAPAKKVEAPKVEASSSVSAPKVEPTTTAASPSATKSASKTSGELMKGAVIMAVMDQYKDIWLSKKPDGKIALEQMDGKICTFEISNGDVKFQQGSFAEVPGDKKKAIETKISELTSGL